eukprot:4373823-Pyramimonas_sp.AAC.1
MLYRQPPRWWATRTLRPRPPLRSTRSAETRTAALASPPGGGAATWMGPATPRAPPTPPTYAPN